MKNKIEYDRSFKIDRNDFPFILMLLRDLSSASDFRVKKKNEEYFYKRGTEIIRMRNDEVSCDISFKNVDKTLVETAEKEYKLNRKINKCFF